MEADVSSLREGRLASASRAALMAGVSVRTLRARLTLSERTLLPATVLVVAVVELMVE